MRSRLQPNEKVLLEVRKHWAVLVPPVFWMLFTGAGVALLIVFEEPTAALFTACSTALAALWLVWQIVSRRYDLWAVTSLRVIDEAGVFSHVAKECALDKIHNVSYRQPLLGRIFNYGHVEIQTAAEMGAQFYTFVTSPKQLKETIAHAQESYKESQVEMQARKLAKAIGEQQGTTAPGAADSKQCPYCAETIRVKAIVCRYCGKDLG